VHPFRPSEQWPIDTLQKMSKDELENLWGHDRDALYAASLYTCYEQQEPFTELLTTKRWLIGYAVALEEVCTDSETRIETQLHNNPKQSLTRMDRLSSTIRSKTAKAKKDSLKYTEALLSPEHGREVSALRTRENFLLRALRDLHPPSYYKELRNHVGEDFWKPKNLNDSHLTTAAIESGFLHVPTNAKTEELLAINEPAFAAAVTFDAEGRRIPELRHPLVHRRWRNELINAARRLEEGFRGKGQGGLPRIDTRKLPQTGEARALLRDRRLYRSVAGRTFECRLLYNVWRYRASQATQERAQEWKRIDGRIYEHLAGEHPDTVELLLDELKPHLDAQGMLIPETRRAVNTLRNSVVGRIKEGAGWGTQH